MSGVTGRMFVTSYKFIYSRAAVDVEEALSLIDR